MIGVLRERGDWDTDASSQGESEDDVFPSQGTSSIAKQTTRSWERVLEQKEPDPPTPWSWTSSPQDWGRVPVCHWSHLPVVLAYGSPRKNYHWLLFKLDAAFQKKVTGTQQRTCTFTAGDGGAPDHIPILQDAGDGLWPLGFDKAIITMKRDRTAKQEPVTKTPSIYGNARIMALVLTKCWKGKEKINRKIKILEY